MLARMWQDGRRRQQRTMTSATTNPRWPSISGRSTQDPAEEVCAATAVPGDRCQRQRGVRHGPERRVRRVHRSRVYAILIDAPQEEAAQATAFWSAALGVPAERLDPEPQFITLTGAIPGLVTAVQAVDDAPRMHIDIETDDVEAETARLIALGAVRIARWQACHVLRVPGGHLVCVLPVESPADVFEAQARTWP
jgi:glyoxalase superfamily protein